MLPLFPLNVVVFPFETIQLHIFEPRYKQLVYDALANNTTFGIPVFLNGTVQPIGTELKIAELVKKYPDGTMDIKAEGLRIFRIENFYQPMPGKLHAGGVVSFLATEDDADITTKIKIIQRVTELYQIMKLNHNFSANQPYLSYKMGNKIGLSLAQQYQLLCLLLESERLEYIDECLNQIIPIVQETERLRELSRMNGFFRKFDPLQF
ncbi:MAG: LON peptidase substrate-binding domain-containing protein [Cytophagales bacterium]|nr:LON peptidase substrate-binding domain-containing protein [Bernardetiaceae bacterium]MDW8211284.1 LON peptidase substrate-binding domain-containing protein [Cytophagales bacterium]